MFSVKLSYVQASSSNINNIIKIKNFFLKLLSDKVSEIHRIINKSAQKDKLKLNITTKRSSRKQIIIPMGSNNAKRVMAKANITVANINKLLKEIMSKISVNFI